MRNNGQNIDPQKNIYRYTKSTQEVTILPWTGTKPIKVNKNSKTYKDNLQRSQIQAMLRQGHSDLEISEQLDISLGYIRKIINKLK